MQNRFEMTHRSPKGNGLVTAIAPDGPALVYLREGEYPSVHHPDEPGALDDAPNSMALAVFCGGEEFSGEILFV